VSYLTNIVSCETLRAMPKKAPRRYSNAEKRQAVACWLTSGSNRHVSRLTGISVPTLYQWRNSVWWAEMEQEVKAALDKKMAAQMRGVAMKAYEELAERLENGDERALPNGDIIRVKVPAKDLNQIGGFTDDRGRVRQGQATRITENRDLNNLAAQFERIAEKYADRINAMQGGSPVIEGEIVRPALPGDKR
jgi:transposase-like protein